MRKPVFQFTAGIAEAELIRRAIGRTGCPAKWLRQVALKAAKEKVEWIAAQSSGGQARRIENRGGSLVDFTDSQDERLVGGEQVRKGGFL